MIGRPDRVRVWEPQIAARDLPPICAMTGRAAETSHVFVFAGPLDWFMAGLAIMGIRLPGLEPRAARGQLPLTSSSKQTITMVETIARSLPALAILLEVCGIALARSTSDTDLSALARTLIILGAVGASLCLPAFVLSEMVPHGRVLDAPPGYSDRLIELHRVHPTFVAAVKHHHLARAAQLASAPQHPDSPASQ